MRYVIMGTGGIGGFFGAMLSKAGEDVWFVARGRHLDAMKRQGLRVRSTAGDMTVPPEKITGNPVDADHADVVLFCVKAYDTEPATRLIAPLLSGNSLVVTLQNGVDNADVMRGIVRHGEVLNGAAYISSRITEPGVIAEVGGFQRIVFGPSGEPISSRARQLHESLVRAGIKAQLEENILKELWRKFIFISSMGSLTALSRLTHGEILAHPRLQALMFDAMREVQSLAWKLGIELEPVDESRVLEGLKRFSDDTRSSMYFDLISEKPMEIEALNGTVVRFGERLGIPTPIHRVIYSVLLPYHLKHMHLSGQSR